MNIGNNCRMKTNIRTVCHSLAGAVCAGAVLLIASSAPAQNLFVGEQAGVFAGGGYITAITPTGTQSTFASGLNFPAGLAFNSAGNLFEADGTDNIYEFTPSGVRSNFAYLGNSAHPDGLAFDSAGNLYVAAPNDENILKITPGGVVGIFANLNDTAEVGPNGLAFDNAGNLFASDPGTGSIYKFTPGGVRSTFYNGIDAYGLAFDSAGNLFATGIPNANGNPADGNIYEFTSNGVTVFASGLSRARGLAFDTAENIYEADSGSGNIYEFTPGGTRTTFASGLNAPYGLAFQPVPEPSALALLAVGTLALLILNRPDCLSRPETDLQGSCVRGLREGVAPQRAAARRRELIDVRLCFTGRAR